MEENNKVDVLSKKRPTVNELKTEVIRLRNDLDKSENGLNHYKSMFDSCCNDNNKLRQDAINLKTSNNDLEARNQALKDIITSLEADLDKVEEIAKNSKLRISIILLHLLLQLLLLLVLLLQ